MLNSIRSAKNEELFKPYLKEFNNYRDTADMTTDIYGTKRMSPQDLFAYISSLTQDILITTGSNRHKAIKKFYLMVLNVEKPEVIYLGRDR